jgi:hypothetical protein
LAAGTKAVSMMAALRCGRISRLAGGGLPNGLTHSGYNRWRPSRATGHRSETPMANEKGPNIKKKQICKNCEGKGLLKKGDRVVKCQRCKGTGVR